MPVAAVLAVLLSVALALGACSAPRGDDTAGGSANGEGVQAVVTIAWDECDYAPGLECATLEVPLDHARPDDGPTVPIALIKLPARDPDARIGSLVVNPGGPGASGVEFVRTAARPTFGDLVDRFDIVGFDPRGVGRSAPLDCRTDLDAYFRVDPSPETDEERAVFTDTMRRFAADCAANGGELLRHIGTTSVARDLERIRVALDDGPLNYVGFSYGTEIGARYAELYPAAIRTMVLDGAVDPSDGTADVLRGQATGFDGQLRRFFEDCDGSDDCPDELRGRSEAVHDAVARRVEEAPLPTRNADGTPSERTLGPGEFLIGVANALYSTGTWPLLAEGLVEAENGDGTVLLELADSYSERNADGSYSNAIEVLNAVSCADAPAPTTDVAAYPALADDFAGSAPRFGPGLAWSALLCTVWPTPPEDTPAPAEVRGAPPILVIGTTRDPATPYADAEALVAQLGDVGVLLTRDGDDHTAFGRGSTCIDEIVQAYLIDAVLPPAGTVCT